MEGQARAVDVADGEVKTFAQAETTGVEGCEEDSVVGQLDVTQQEADFLSRKDDGKLEMGGGTDDAKLMRPRALKGHLPVDFDGAEGLIDGGVGEKLDGLEVDKVRLNLLEGEKIGRAAEVFA